MGDGEYHAVHEYNDTLHNIFTKEFPESPEFAAFQESTGRKTIGYSKFVEGALLCPCIQPPTMRVCVDEIETKFREVVTTLQSIRQKGIKCNCNFCIKEIEQKTKQGKGDYHILLCIYVS